MNLRQVVELAAIVSQHSPNLVEASAQLSDAALSRYCDASQAQIRNWLVALNDLPQEIIATPAEWRHHVWRRAEATLIDVLAGGLVVRVWGAVLTACDRSRRTIAAEKVARTVLSSQLQAQQRVLRLLMDGPHLTLERVIGLDRLRRKIERWTDLLVGRLVRQHALADFAFDLERALDFGEEQLHDLWGQRHNQIWDLYFVCLRSAFPDRKLPAGISGELRDELLQSILGCFPGELFLNDGALKSVGLQRLLNSGTRPEGPPLSGRYSAARLRIRAGLRRRGADREPEKP